MISFQYKKKSMNSWLKEWIKYITWVNKLSLIVIFYYYFKDKNIAPINVISFWSPFNTYESIKNGNVSTRKAKENQEQFKSNLNEIARGNPRPKSKYQLDTIKNIRSFYEWREEILKLYNDYAKIKCEAAYGARILNDIYGQGFKIITLKQMPQRLPIALAQVKVGNSSEHLLN